MSRLRRTLRRTRRGLTFGLAGLVIVAGLAVAVLSQLLPLLARHPQAVAEWMSRQAGRPIEITGLRAAWTRSGPRFDLDGLRIGEGDDRLEIGRAELQLHAYSGLLPGRPLSSLQLTGLQLDLERDGLGQWRLQGLARSPSGGSATAAMEQLDALGELLLHNARLRVHEPSLGIDFVVPEIDARVRRRDGELWIGALATLADASRLRLNFALDQATLRGRGYVGSTALPMATLHGLLPVDARRFVGGELAGGLWFALDADGFADAELAATLDGLRLPGATPADAVSSADPASVADAERPAVDATASEPADIALPSITLDARWQRHGDGWRASLQSPRADGESAWLAVQRAADGRLQIEAADWPLAPLALVAAALPQTSPGLAAWLQASALRGELRGLQLGRHDGRIDRLDARIDELGFAPVGAAPGLSGLSLGLRGDADVLDVELRGTPLTLDWPDALLSPLQPMLQGRLQLFRDDGVPAIEIGSLRLREPDYGIDVAGGLRFDGGRPSATLRADVAAAPIVVAKRFWIRHRMPPNTVAWLDRAIEDGRLEGGRALVSGDLDDWPFAGNEGRFEAEARIAETRLQFHPQWPAAEQLAGIARFVNNSMDVEVRGSLRGLDATKAVGRIAEFGRPLLDLSIDGHASGSVMLDLLRHSPLQASHGVHLDALTIGGRGDVDIALAIPLRPDLGTTRVQGTVRLHDAELADSRWGLAFDGADGAVRFSERGLLADPLQVRYGGQPAQFGLAIGSFTGRPSNIVEARLSGRFEADTLLAAAPSIDWLRPFWSGRSDWWLELDVPQPERALAPSLRVRSDLVGTRIALPAPLAKADAVQMPLELLYDLPVAAIPASNGDDPTAATAASPGRLELRLGELLRLYGRLGDDGRLDGVAAFGGAAGAERPERGLRVIGQVPVLDLGGWAGLALATDNGGDGLLAGVDLSAGQIDLLDRSFAETSLTFDRNADGSARLQVGGDVVQGVVELPPPTLQATRGITGRFERLYWPEAQPGAASLSLADPASLPPLHVWIGDLRLGDARLGEARLESFAVEQGMRVERFETRSPALDLFARGDWVRSGLQQRSDFSIEFTAPDLGGMLRALGFEALIDGGQTLARLQAHWPGAPSSFSLDAVDGWLEVSVGKGRIPKVDPGGVGRVFGLLSLSEIPRRLALDFSDFFRSGLAFNRIEGRFTLDDGDALTDNLLIDGPAAEIRIKGRTGLEARDYAQTMEVLPRAGNVLPVVGALAGGPAGAAIGAVAQAMLAKPFKQMTRTLYKVEGSWDDPRIEVLERGPARPPEATAEAADGPPGP